MKKLRRFNPNGLRYIEFRENPEGIRIYEFNRWSYKFDKYLGLIKFISTLVLDFEPNYKCLKFNADFLFGSIDDFNKILKSFWGEYTYLIEEAINYLESIYLMEKLMR